MGLYFRAQNIPAETDLTAVSEFSVYKLQNVMIKLRLVFGALHMFQSTSSIKGNVKEGKRNALPPLQIVSDSFAVKCQIHYNQYNHESHN